MEFKVASFYKYIKVRNPERLMGEIRLLCERLGLKGRILIGNEGINGVVSGKIGAVEVFKKQIKQNKSFSDLTFREQAFPKQTYSKLVVRVRDEIVHFGKKVDLKKTGKHISPKTLKSWLDKNKNIVLIDARNQYETKVGKFKGALTLPMENFRDFPKASKKLGKIKDKNIVMYCTGGIRCEKASAFLKAKGVRHVYQLQGGIINFVNQFPDTYFEGSCFVFDDRLASKVSKKVFSKCDVCGSPSDDMINCVNLDCDKRFISCKECQGKMKKTCCKKCFASPRKRK